MSVSLPEPLEEYLSSLSHAQFRQTNTAIGQELIPTLDDATMWQLVIRLTRYDNRAFLGTLLKALVERFASRRPRANLQQHVAQLRLWAADMTTVDRHKTLLALLPLSDTPQEVSMMLETFGQHGATIGHGHDIDYLIQCDTAAAYYVMLGYMRMNEHNTTLLTSICRRVMQRGSGRAFNAASLFKVFFDLREVHGTFSLHIQPYELSHLENDFAYFCSKIN